MFRVVVMFFFFHTRIFVVRYRDLAEQIFAPFAPTFRSRAEPRDPEYRGGAGGSAPRSFDLCLVNDAVLTGLRGGGLSPPPRFCPTRLVSSRVRANPMPPPMHRVANPPFKLRRFISLMARPLSDPGAGAPDGMPDGNGATVGVLPFASPGCSTSRMQAIAWEAKASLSSISSTWSMVPAGFGLRARRVAGITARAHVGRIDCARRIGFYAGQGL